MLALVVKATPMWMYSHHAVDCLLVLGCRTALEISARFTPVPPSNTVSTQQRLRMYFHMYCMIVHAVKPVHALPV